MSSTPSPWSRFKPFVRVSRVRSAGAHATRLVRVEGRIPFDWDVDGTIKTRDVAAKMPELPQLVPGPGPFRYFGADERTPPFLWTSFESPGLQLGGTVGESEWQAWTPAFGEKFATFPLRRIGR